MLKRYGKLVVFLVACGDLAAAALAWPAGYALRALWGSVGLTPHAMPPFWDFVPYMVVSLGLSMLLFARLDLYATKRTKSQPREIWDVCRAVVLAWGIAYFVNVLLTHQMPSRLMMISSLGAWLVLATTYRALSRRTLRRFRRKGWNLRHAAIIGTGRLAQKLFHALRQNPWTGIMPHYFVDDEPLHEELCGLAVFKPIGAIADIVAIKPVDSVFVALPAERHEQVALVLDQLVGTNVAVHVVPDLLSFSFLSQDVSQLENLPVISMTHSPLHGWYSVAKRLFDIVFSLASLVVLSPLMIVIALLVKLTSKGPVFYRQVRASLSGKQFSIIKFRTMSHDAEDDTGPVWAHEGDTRKTKIGKILRKLNLDELPQLLNILLGHMSLVGPRPERPEHIERLRRQVPRYMLRSQVKSGLTGWAQVNGWRGNTSPRKRVQYDLHYITNWTFGLDLWIIVLTLFRSFRDPNAY